MEVDLVRQLVELAVTAGRSHQSAQTSFIHYCHQRVDETVNHTIPVYENVLFALALIRMQTVQNITEGMEIISKILDFQNPESGNFPVYLHQYPNCQDRYASVHLLAPLYWVVKGFQKVLGKELEEKITASMKKVLSYTDDHYDKAPFQLAVKIAAAEVAYGKYWKDKKMEKRGHERLDRLREISDAPDFGTWFSPVYIAETLVALQMVYEKISESPWSKFWTMLRQTWYLPARTYVGPPVKTLQWQGEPQPTLYDLYLGDFTGGYPYHSFIDHPFQVQGALVRSIDDKFEPMTYPMTVTGEVAGHRWVVHQEEAYAYSIIETGAPLPPELKKGFHHFRLVWGDKNQIHSLSCQASNFTSMTYDIVDGGVDLLFWLAEDPDQLDREKSHEVRFFIDQHEGLDIKVNDKKATAFNFRDKIQLITDRRKFSLSFHLEEGDGRLMGHIQPGNRISQVDLKGENRYKAFDWEIFLRTVRRYTPCYIRAEVRFQH